MCEKCFTKDIDQFLSQSEFEVFIKQLSQKDIELVKEREGNLGKSKFTIFGIGFGGSIDYGYKVYKCKYCGQLWKLSVPDNAWRGYFVEAKEDFL